MTDIHPQYTNAKIVHGLLAREAGRTKETVAWSAYVPTEEADAFDRALDDVAAQLDAGTLRYDAFDGFTVNE